MSGGEFAAIEARVAAASEGPWYVEGSDVRVAGPGVEDVAYDMLDHDAEFIAHARVDIPALLAAVRERDNTIAKVRAYMHEHEEYLPAAVNYDCCARCNAITGSYVPWPCDPYTRLRAALDPQETE